MELRDVQDMPICPEFMQHVPANVVGVGVQLYICTAVSIVHSQNLSVRPAL